MTITETLEWNTTMHLNATNTAAKMNSEMTFHDLVMSSDLFKIGN